MTINERARDRGSGAGYRPDLEGLRGVAILLVLLFHAGLPWLPGGFIGVDVFFVLSGFLITGLLVREATTSGSIDFRAFYARRARRILPASLVVIVATLAASAAVLDPLDLSRVAGDGLAAAASVANLRFAAGAMDYFGSSSAPSPLLHYWSLGVEEQFYLVWPALLLISSRWRSPRAGAAVVLSMVIAGSFLASLYLTGAAAPWAFYSLPARAWQLALGGLLALVALPNIRLVRWPLALLSWAGLAAIVLAAIALDPSAPYPGWVALAPSVGAAALVLGGDRRWSVGGLLSTRPMRFLGRISFSLYLVHWPILVLPATLLPIGATLPAVAVAGLAAASVVVATVLHHVIEEPFHRGHRISLPSGRVLALAGSAIVATSILAVGIDGYASHQLDVGESALVSVGGDDGSALVTPAPGGPGSLQSPNAAESMTGTAGTTRATGPTEAGSARTATHATPTQPVATASTAPSAPPATAVPSGPIPLPRDVRPSVADAPGDRDALSADGCLAGYAVTTPPDCVFGDIHGTVTVALVGDSHAAQWFPALEIIATERHWRLVTFTKLSCRFMDLPMFSRVLKREYTECEAWRPEVVARLETLRPDLTIVAAARGPEMMNQADTNPVRQGLAMARLLRPVGGRIAIVADSPESLVDVPACISGHVSDLRPCQTPRRAALGWRPLIVEQTAAQALGATVVDLTDSICPGDPCPVVVDRIIVYRDDHHLTATFAASLAGKLEAALPAF